MKKFLPLLFYSFLLLVSCYQGSRFRIYTERGREKREDSTSLQKPKDTIPPLARQLTYEKFNFTTDLIIQNLVRAQKMVYERRYTEARALVEQTLIWYPTPEALLLLGSIHHVQGDLTQADSCWHLARELGLKSGTIITIPQK
jgi:hypothetical protein